MQGHRRRIGRRSGEYILIEGGEKAYVNAEDGNIYRKNYPKDECLGSWDGNYILLPNGTVGGTADTGLEAAAFLLNKK